MDQAAPINQQSPDYALTPEGIEALETELLTLREKRTRIARGEPNHEDEAILRARIAALQEVLDEAWIIEPSALVPGVVAIGAYVGLRDVETGASERYRVVGKHEPLRPAELSAASAVGRALAGRRVGETVSVDLPNGGSRRLEVTSAEPRAPGA